MSGRRPTGKGAVSILQGRIPRARWAAGQSLQWPMPREIGVVWSSALVCGARLCQQWSGACLSYTLKVVDSTLLLGLFDKCLGTTDAKCGSCPGACWWYMAVLLGTPDGKCLSVGGLLCRHGCSDHMCRYLKYLSLPHMSALT